MLQFPVKEPTGVRQIADETKIPKSTVARIISTVPNGTVELPSVVVGKDGKQRQAVQPERKAPEKSDRQLAKAIGVDHKTVSAQRGELEGRGEIPHVESRTDTLGRSQPATRQVERKAPEPELGLNVGKSHIYEAEPILHTEESRMYEPEPEPEPAPPRIISIQVSAPSQVNRVAEKASAVLEAAQENPAIPICIPAVYDPQTTIIKTLRDAVILHWWPSHSAALNV